MVVAGRHTRDVLRGGGCADVVHIHVYAVVGLSIACVAWPWAGGLIVDAYCHSTGDRGGLFVVDDMVSITWK